MGNNKEDTLIDCEMTDQNTLTCRMKANNREASTEIAIDSNNKPKIISKKGSRTLLEQEIPKIMKDIKVGGGADFQSNGEH